MRKANNHIIFSGLLLCLACLVITSCSTTRTVPEGDRLYTGSDVKWISDTVTKKKPKDYSDLADGRNSRIRPKRNRRVLGMPFKLWLYN